MKRPGAAPGVPADRAPEARTMDEASERLPSTDELLFMQLGQTLVATRAQAIATIEQCNAALMVVGALQSRENERAAASAAPPVDPRTPMHVKTFGSATPNAGASHEVKE